MKSPTFNNIVVFPHSERIKNSDDDEIFGVLEILEEFAKDRNLPYGLYNDNVFDPYTAMGLEPSNKTLFIGVGGDGTMLKAAKESVHHGGTVFGINMGKLGFLTDYDIGEYHAWDGIESLLDDIYHYNKESIFLDKRLVLEADSGNGREHLAINEFLVAFKESMRGMMEYDIYASGRFVAKQSSSGVIVSTPTGSTAFALSVGGPIISPRSNSILVLPIAAHTLTSRPIVVSGVRDTVEIVARNKTGRKIELYSDDKVVDETDVYEMRVMIKPHRTMARFWHRKGWNFFDVLSEKMKWG